ncbi:GNAT family N-acetyltransferase [Robiginitalea aurantiaca]|uniref:GNAT family N-acetyltransferase n=1 Tax=Robiginitalea aurantiaca TaxID=3056915 RepID=A0ABT7WGB9_9FLAO|nr:GNAT family N-acetyltransferase [Robiginitalea aurantiaca]MDM9631968.1 GNAT family N-acetyltransferase [Robiginitalea aurantiaca]
MKLLKGAHIALRALEPDDLEYLYSLENDTDIWEISGTLAPYSKKVLKDYLDRAHCDIYQAKQLRLVICSDSEPHIGLIDLYDFDPRNLRAGIGIVISQPGNRDRGFGAEALSLLCEYAFQVLDLHQLYAGVSADNSRSIHLFEKLGFQQNGVRKDWLRTSQGFKDELLFQKIRTDVY